MTKGEIINLIEETFKEKVKQNDEFIRYSFYEVNIKYPLKDDEEREVFLYLLKNKLNNNKYKVYLEGQEFEYKGKKEIVQRNDKIIAIKNKRKEDVKHGIIQRGSSKKIKWCWNKGRN